MHAKRTKSNCGFTLMEALVGTTLGLLVVGIAVQLYSKAVDATWMVSQRTQMQQDIRAAQVMMLKDISMAGTGLTAVPGGVALVDGTGTAPVYGCDQTKCYLPTDTGAGVKFPVSSTARMYWIIPGNKLGKEVFSGKGNTDAISVTYADQWFALQCYDVSFPSNTTAQFKTKTSLPPTCQPPALPQAVQQVNDPAYGLKAGDLVMFTNSAGGMAIAEVTENAPNPVGNPASYTVKFSNPDKLKLNQPAATTGSLQQMISGSGTTAIRLLMISYYIDVINGIPTLMRQVNGQTPVPLAENVVDLRITYDTYDDDGNFTPAQGTVSPSNINLIRKVNIAHLTARSSARGNKVTGFASLDLQTSVSLRNMSFENRYGID